MKRKIEIILTMLLITALLFSPTITRADSHISEAAQKEIEKIEKIDIF